MFKVSLVQLGTLVSACVLALSLACGGSSSKSSTAAPTVTALKPCDIWSRLPEATLKSIPSFDVDVKSAPANLADWPAIYSGPWNGADRSAIIVQSMTDGKPVVYYVFNDKLQTNPQGQPLQWSLTPDNNLTWTNEFKDRTGATVKISFTLTLTKTPEGKIGLHGERMQWTNGLHGAPIQVDMVRCAGPQPLH